MKKLISFFALLAIANAANSQMIIEAGVSPLTTRLRPAVTVSPVYSLNQVEFSAPFSYEYRHNANAGVTVGYRLRSDAASTMQGVTLHAGAGYSWYATDAIKSGEVENQWLPIVGLKFVNEGRNAGAGIFEIRYQGGGFLLIYGYRF